MQAKTIATVGSFAALPVLYVAISVLHVMGDGRAIEHWLPRWDRLLILVSVLILERLFAYRYAVSQRHMLPRDIMANIVNLWITAAVTGLLVVPVLTFIPEHFLGRKLIFASSAQLGPLWLQMIVIVLSVSLFRYWMHRWQHKNEFLWSLHSYHHRVTDLTATNTEVSNPVDFALRNILVFFILGVVGFDPLAILLTVPAMNVVAAYSHCAGDVKAGPLNYLFVTPEVHRWHHTAEVPEGHKFSVNYGVEFSFWDVVFGTFHLPQKNGETLQPARLGHPSGLPDESNYFKILLAPFGLYRPLPWFARATPMAGGPES